MALTGLEIPESIVSGLGEGLGDDLLAVVLFGSWARGEAREGCDWDYLDLIWSWEEPPGLDWSLEWKEIP
jgi:predicted nucleotidyltransferase